MTSLVSLFFSPQMTSAIVAVYAGLLIDVLCKVNVKEYNDDEDHHGQSTRPLISLSIGGTTGKTGVGLPVPLSSPSAKRRGMSSV